MITLFITAQIIFTLNAATMPLCKDLGYPVLDGCYVKNKIYISEVTSRPKDYTLYHEIGHSLLNKDYFKKKLKTFPDVETMAWEFADYVYDYKYNLNTKIPKKHIKIFTKKCPEKCLKEIINIPFNNR